MTVQSPEGAPTQDERRRRTLLLILPGFVVVVVMFSVCSGRDSDDDAAPATTQAQASPSEPTASTAATATTATTSAAPEATGTIPAAATTSSAPQAATTTSSVATTSAPADTGATSDINVEWTCQEPGVLGSGVFGTTCTTRSRDLFFVGGNFFMTIDYTRDADGNPVSMAVRTRVSGPSCFWTSVDAEPNEAPVVAGKATHSGVFIGEGDCSDVQVGLGECLGRRGPHVSHNRRPRRGRLT